MADSFIFLNFNFYGFLIGLAVVVAWWFLAVIKRRLKLRLPDFDLLSMIFLFGALIGARFWHILTTWQSYQNNLWLTLAVWQGGLSIWGAIWGGLVFLQLYFYLWQNKLWKKLWLFLDILVFVLPLSQAIGRVGNWFNQELYGLPTHLPWKIFIDTNHRLSGFENQAFYHPLFLYEILGLLVFAFFYYVCFIKKKLQVGQGKYFVIYLGYYTTLRFFLEFLRLDKASFAGFHFLSINQILSILAFLIFLVVYQLQKHR